MRVLFVLITGLVVVVLGTTGCSSSTYDQRIAYLQTVAARGAQTHDLLVSQRAPKIDVERCTAAYVGGLNGGDAPSDRASGSTTQWLDQVQAFFVDSCASGLPRPVVASDAPGGPAGAPVGPAPTN